jgi:two-component system response regulator YesN
MIKYRNHRLIHRGVNRMLKVFLVEDEFVVREGMKHNIAWSENGFIFCGEASDGELALNQIRQKRPDIIITDIKMPFMNGLELSRLIKKENPEIKIIILSGYGEFDYAKEAINIGVEEYLLKPINATELLKSVKRVAEKIMADREEKENRMKFRKEMHENEVQSRRNFFQEMIYSSLSLSDILDKGRQLGINLYAGYYNIILFKVNSRKHRDEYFSKTLVSLSEELDAYFEKHNILWFDRSLEGYAILLKAETVKELEQQQKEYITEVERLICMHEKVTYFGGIGCCVNRLSELYLSFEEASRAFAYRFIVNQSQFLEASRMNEIKSQEENPWVDVAKAPYLDKEVAEKFLRNGELGEVNYFVEEYLMNYAKAAKKSLIFRQYILMDMYFITVNFMEKLGKDNCGKPEDPFQAPQQMNHILGDYEETISYVKNLFVQAITCRNEAATGKFSNIVEETKEYIHNNYQTEELSLNSAASYVNISPSYLSSVFSQETGQTFVKYLTDHRMNKAKELLVCTNKRSSEIGSEVGYKDPHYFSYLFKKTQGCTPLQFRTSKSRNEEAYV